MNEEIRQWIPVGDADVYGDLFQGGIVLLKGVVEAEQHSEEDRPHAEEHGAKFHIGSPRSTG